MTIIMREVQLCQVRAPRRVRRVERRPTTTSRAKDGARHNHPLIRPTCAVPVHLAGGRACPVGRGAMPVERLSSGGGWRRCCGDCRLPGTAIPAASAPRRCETGALRFAWASEAARNGTPADADNSLLKGAQNSAGCQLHINQAIEALGLGADRRALGRVHHGAPLPCSWARL